MGVFQRQGLKYSVVNWFGICIGALSTVFVFPYALEEYGIIRFVLDTSLLVFPLVSLGMSYVILRFFPYFKDQDTQNHGFLGLMLLWTIAGCLFFCALAYCFKEPLLARYGSKNPLFERYLWLTLPAVFLTAVNTLFLRYAINYNRVVVPSLLVDVMPKVVLPLLVIGYLKHWLSLDMVISVSSSNFARSTAVMSPSDAAMVKSVGSISQVPLVPSADAVVTRAVSAMCT